MTAILTLAALVATESRDYRFREWGGRTAARVAPWEAAWAVHTTHPDPEVRRRWTLAARLHASRMADRLFGPAWTDTRLSHDRAVGDAVAQAGFDATPLILRPERSDWETAGEQLRRGGHSFAPNSVLEDRAVQFAIVNRLAFDSYVRYTLYRRGPRAVAHVVTLYAEASCTPAIVTLFNALPLMRP